MIIIIIIIIIIIAKIKKNLIGLRICRVSYENC